MIDDELISIEPNFFYNKKINNNKVNVKIYEIFPRQELAFQYFDSLNDSLKECSKIYSFESVNNGIRKFLVADFNTFCDKYFNNNNNEQNNFNQSISSPSLPYGHYYNQNFPNPNVNKINDSLSINKDRHFYEVIRDSWPCRAYFDLEFSISSNKDLNGDNLTSKWINLVVWKIYMIWKIYIDDKSIIVLDSTTAEKFSKHVIIILPGIENNNIKTFNNEILFKNNLCIGALVESILEDITYEAVEIIEINKNESNSINNSLCNESIQCPIYGRKPKLEYKDFWVNPKDSASSNKKVCFVDLGVYTKNRAFRLYQSSKYGKDKVFQPLLNDRRIYKGLIISDHSKINQLSLSPNPFANKDVTHSSLLNSKIEILKRSFVLPYNVFLYAKNNATEVLSDKNNEIIINTPENYDATSNNDDNMKQISNFNDEIFNNNFLNLERNKINNNINVSNLFLDHEKEKEIDFVNSFVNISSTTVTSAEWKKRLIDSSSITNTSKKIKNNYFCESLDKFVLLNSCKGGNQGKIDKWSLFATRHNPPQYKLRYFIIGNKFCENIKREHKSNQIFFEVDILNKNMIQLCWDIDCKSSIPTPITIPDAIMNEIDIETIKDKYFEQNLINSEIWNNI